MYSKKTQEGPKFSPLAAFEGLCKQEVKAKTLGNYWGVENVPQHTQGPTAKMGNIISGNLRKSLSNHWLTIELIKQILESVVRHNKEYRICRIRPRSSLNKQMAAAAT